MMYSDWNIEKTTRVYSKSAAAAAADKVVTTGQLNFTTNAAPLEETKDVEESITLSSIFVQSKFGDHGQVDPLLEESASEEQEGTEETEEESSQDEEVRVEIFDATTGSLTLNKTTYELNFSALQTGAVASISEHLKFFIINKNQFFVVVSQVAEDGSVTEQVWSAERVSEGKQLSFFQKYGTSLMLGGFFLVSNIFKKAAPTPAAAPAAAAAQ